MYYLLTFDNTHKAIQVKKVLSRYMSIRTVPILREISASCGISIRIEEKDYDTLLKIINDHKLDNFDIYEIRRDKIYKLNK